MTKRITYWTGLAGVLLFVTTTILGGLLIPNYNHASQFISESYAIDTPYGIYLRILGFIPSGICLAVFSFSSIYHTEKSTLAKIGFLGIGIFYGIGTIIVSIFPCDIGCNKELIDPSVSQIIHNITGTLTYFFVPVSILLIGIGMIKKSKSLLLVSIATVVICISFIALLSANPMTNFAGLYQRIIEGSILFWVLIFSWRIYKGELVAEENNTAR